MVGLPCGARARVSFSEPPPRRGPIGWRPLAQPGHPARSARRRGDPRSWGHAAITHRDLLGRARRPRRAPRRRRSDATTTWCSPSPAAASCRPGCWRTASTCARSSSRAPCSTCPRAAPTRPVIGHFPDAELLAGRRVLVIDEVWETGETMTEVLARVRAAGGRPVSAVIHYKPGRSRVAGAPDHYAAEVDELGRRTRTRPAPDGGPSQEPSQPARPLGGSRQVRDGRASPRPSPRPGAPHDGPTPDRQPRPPPRDRRDRHPRASPASACGTCSSARPARRPCPSATAPTQVPSATAVADARPRPIAPASRRRAAPTPAPRPRDQRRHRRDVDGRPDASARSATSRARSWATASRRRSRASAPPRRSAGRRT